MATIGELNENMRRQLSEMYGRGEGDAMVRVIWEHLKGWQPVDIVLHTADSAADCLISDINNIMRPLANGEPLQYVLGEARFFGMTFDVNRSTLIPRPETEGLVQLVIDDAKNRPDLRILDVGTGSGAIAVSLARNLPFAQVRAIDISQEALSVAKDNARRLRVNVNFMHADIFDYTLEKGGLDIVVSNPPYVLENERTGMSRNVLDFEPESAIFAPENDAIAFYRAITRLAYHSLVSGGRLYFELNPLTADAVASDTENVGFIDVDLLRDIHGRIRYLTARRP